MVLSKHKIVNATLSPMYEHDLQNAPHGILELSNNEWKRLQSHSTHISRYNVTKLGKRLVSYNFIKYGDKVVLMKKKTLSSGKPIWFNEMNL